MRQVKRNLFLSYMNDTGADQTVHMHSLICAFVVCCLENIIATNATLEFFKIQTSLCS